MERVARLNRRLPSLLTPGLQSGLELAVKLSRMVVKLTRPGAEIRDKLRAGYENDADALIPAAGVVAMNFQTIAAANAYWKERNGTNNEH